MRLLNFDLGAPTPDENTIRLFRNKLTETGTLKRVMKAFDWQLHKKGHIPMSGQIVDASLVPAPKQRNTDPEKEAIKAGKSAQEIWPDEPNKAVQKDVDARWTLKIGEKVSALVQELQNRFGFLPSWEDCHKAAEEVELELPTGLADVRIHDLRHTFASGAVMMGESLPMIGKQLGHTQPQTTARYAHLADDPLRSAVQRIDAMLEEAMVGE